MLERLSSFRACSVKPPSPTESSASRRAELEGLEGSAQAALARLAEEKKVRTCARFLFFIMPRPLSSCYLGQFLLHDRVLLRTIRSGCYGSRAASTWRAPPTAWSPPR